MATLLPTLEYIHNSEHEKYVKNMAKLQNCVSKYMINSPWICETSNKSECSSLDCHSRSIQFKFTATDSSDKYKFGTCSPYNIDADYTLIDINDLIKLLEKQGYKVENHKSFGKNCKMANLTIRMFENQK